ncbi:MAG: DUF229 domain-containing protein [Bacteroidetes bacterium]|nr:MAG: DUF229 domain-containing protein [Bacteroidota bacterium]
MRYSLLPILLSLLACQPSDRSASQLPFRPHILWISCEDITPMLGAYDFPGAVTPNLDALAAQGVRYDRAFAPAPVCAPARSTLITGVHANSLGSMHLRSEVRLPAEIKGFPHYMRAAGYYCTNWGKEDYNFLDTTMWSLNVDPGHGPQKPETETPWRGRPAGTPFFSVINLGITHQSQIFGDDESFAQRISAYLSPEERHRPEEVVLPPYHPDIPEVRALWARYYDNVTAMDKQVGQILANLEADGLIDSTLIFFFADHGTGMPRAKRAAYDSGLRVPLLIKAPAALQAALGLTPGTTDGQLVSFVDFAPTLLKLAGAYIPDYMQGRPFLGSDLPPEAEYVFGSADRVDEGFELTRTVRNQDFRYTRNFLPQLPLIQPNFYSDQSEINQVLNRTRAERQLSPAQAALWATPRPIEELYDLRSDPDEIHNLAGDPAHAEVLATHRAALRAHLLEYRDSGFLPEAYMHQLAGEGSVYAALRDSGAFPLQTILKVIDIAHLGEMDALAPYLTHAHPLVRYWATEASLARGEEARVLQPGFLSLLDDPEPVVQLAAVDALLALGTDAPALPVLRDLMQNPDRILVLQACRTFELAGPKADPIRAEAQTIMDRLCGLAEGRWYGYALYSCWSLRQAFK